MACGANLRSSLRSAARTATLTGVVALLVLSSAAASGKTDRRVVDVPREFDQDGDRVRDAFARDLTLRLELGDTELVPVNVGLDRAPTAADIAAIEAHGGAVLSTWSRVLFGMSALLPADAVFAYAAETKHVTFVQPDHSGQARSVLATRQVGARAIWQGTGALSAYSGRSYHRVAVLDTGVDDSHTDIDLVNGGWVDLVTADSQPHDNLGHGTMVAGLATGTGAASPPNRLDITVPGYFPAAANTYTYESFPVRVGSTARSLIAELWWAASGNARVTLLNDAGGQLSTSSGSTKPRTTSVNITNATSEGYRAGFRWESGATGFFRAQVRAPYNPYDSDPLTAGVANGSEVVGVRVVDDNGQTTAARIIDGLEWVESHRGDLQIVVVTLSATLNDGTIDTALDTAVNNLVDAGVAVVVAAGNSQQEDVYIASPGTAAKAITVGAVNHKDETTFYTAIGDPSRPAKPDLVAPGGTDHILGDAGGRPIIAADTNDKDSAKDSGGTWRQNDDGWANDYLGDYGTSYSAAIVAGSVALIADALGGWGWVPKPTSEADPVSNSPRTAKMALLMTAHEVQDGETSASSLVVEEPGPPGRAFSPQDRTEGYGRLDVQTAIEALTVPFDAASTTATFGAAVTNRKALGRYIDLVPGSTLNLNVAVAAGLDADVYLYRATPDNDGAPYILTSSNSSALGTDETLSYTAPTGETNVRTYVVVKWVSGSGDVIVTGTHDEVCDGIDNDGDGSVDETSTGSPLSKTCYEDTVQTRGVGTCRDGVRTCAAGVWSACEDQVRPNGFTKFKAEYYTGMDFDRLEATWSEDMLQFSNDPDGLFIGQPTDYYSSKWSSQFCVGSTGRYELRLRADCRHTLTVDIGGVPTQLVADDGDCNSSVQEYVLGLDLDPGCVAIQATHRHGTGLATFDLDFRPPAAGTWLPLTGVWTQKSPVLCDNQDDDCNGLADDLFPDKGRACDGTDVDQCQNGTYTCSANQLVLECVNENPANILEDCNGQDDDCDGSVDEGLDFGVLTRPCWEGPPGISGVGQCSAGVERCDWGTSRWTGVCTGQSFPTGVQGFRATFYDDETLTNIVATEDIATVDFLSANAGFHPSQPADGFSARFETDLCVAKAGTYTVYCTADDGQRLFFDEGEGHYIVLDGEWDVHLNPVTVPVELELEARCYGLRYEMFDREFSAMAKLEIEGPDLPRQTMATPYAWVREEASCNYVDDDCDGETDEGWVVGAPCDGDDKDFCENGLTICSADGTVTECGPEDPADIDETCNANDDDCDGDIDEDFPLGDFCAVGVGACLREGEYICDPDQVSFVCSVVPAEPTEEICNGIDDDCDGLTDENAEEQPLTQHCYEGPLGTENVGACIGGLNTCIDGEWGPCDGQIVPAGTRGFDVEWFDNPNLEGDPVATENVDDIEIALTAEESPLPELPVDGFSARFTGSFCAPITGAYTFYATSDDGQRLYFELDGAPAAVINDWENHAPTERSVTLTLDEGCHEFWYEWYDHELEALALLEFESQDAGIVRRNVAPPFVWEAEEAFCDNRDDDCNGETDEEYPLGDACDGDDSDLCTNGVLVCSIDGMGTTCGEESPADITEQCNGADDDCDGETDEVEPGVPLNMPCYTGPEGTLDVGACAAGLTYCANGMYGACVGAYTPSNGYRVEYFDGASFDTFVGEAIVPNVNLSLEEGETYSDLQTEGWISARFGSSICVEAEGIYTVRATATNGQRLYVNPGSGWVNVGESWRVREEHQLVVPLFLGAGCTPFRYEIFDTAGPKTARLEISIVDGIWEFLSGTWTSRSDEICNGIDDDCDGVTDEGEMGETDYLPIVESCYGGPTILATLGQGTCAAGERTCGDDGAWGECSATLPANFSAGFVATWYATPDLTGDPVLVEDTPFAAASAAEGVAPFDGMPVENYSVRWEGQFCIEGPVSTLRFLGTVDDGQRLFLHVDGEWLTILDDWEAGDIRTTESADVALAAGCYQLRYEAWNGILGFKAELEFASTELQITQQLVSYPRVWQLAEGLCDGVDDDCDGQTDDEWFDELGTACDGDDSDFCANGVLVCAADGLGTACGVEDPADIVELCNGADDNCDGALDEAFPQLGAACDGGDSDSCATGTFTCSPDGLGLVCENETGDPQVEVCDNADNDCDGETDETFTDLGVACDGDDSDQCANGVYVCAPTGDGVECGVEDIADIAEECNSIDDDCDGDTDEGLGITSCGLGVCEHTIVNCVDGEVQTCDPFEGQGVEVCDGRDNDCDGEADDEQDGALCDDGNPCTDDSCDGFGGCVFAPNMAACDDGDACTTNDVCVAGECVGGDPPVCDDGNPCTTDTCDPAVGCQWENNTEPCDDGDACTDDDSCSDGSCRPGSPVVCDDENPCTDDSCYPLTGCEYDPNTDSCDDGDACTTDDVCLEGACTAGADLVCDDENICTTDTCDPATGCVFENNTELCDDGDACTDGDICADGACTAGAPVDCDDGDVCTTDSCDPATGCANEFNTEPCDDGDPCTVDEVCAEGLCQTGAPKDCDDLDSCTEDSCDAETGDCLNVAIEGCCHNDAGCDADANEFCVLSDLEEGADDGFCAPGICSECEADEDCGGEADLCVESAAGGKYCGRDCSDGQECPPETECQEVGDGVSQCLPLSGDHGLWDCDCTDEFAAHCHEGDIYWFSSCGQLGEVETDCEERGCVFLDDGDICCAEGQHEEDGVCVDDPQPEPSPEIGKPDVAQPDSDVNTSGEGVTMTDTGGGDNGDGGGGGGGGGCNTGGGSAPAAGLGLALLALALVFRRRRSDQI